MAEVNADVLGLFEEAADDLIAQHDGDAKMALCKTLAYLSGQYKQVLEARSLLNGQQGCVTFQIQLEKPFYSVSLIWNILRRHLPEDMSHQVKGMRAFKDMTGACFDLPDDNSQRVIDIFANLAEQ